MAARCGGGAERGVATGEGDGDDEGAAAIGSAWGVMTGAPLGGVDGMSSSVRRRPRRCPTQATDRYRTAKVTTKSRAQARTSGGTTTSNCYACGHKLVKSHSAVNRPRRNSYAPGRSASEWVVGRRPIAGAALPSLPRLHGGRHRIHSGAACDRRATAPQKNFGAFEVFFFSFFGAAP